jgi:phage gp37-like protein
MSALPTTDFASPVQARMRQWCGPYLRRVDKFNTEFAEIAEVAENQYAAR